LVLLICCFMCAGVLAELAQTLETVSVWLVGGDRFGPLFVCALEAPRGGAEQQQFHSMLVSLLKLGAVLRQTFDYARQTEALAGTDCWQAAISARAQIGMIGAQDSGTPASSDQAETAAAAAAAAPWLAVFGRCCMLWGVELRQLQQSRPNLGQQLAQLARGGTLDIASVQRVLQLPGIHAAVVALIELEQGVTFPFTAGVAECAEWLGARGRVQALTALGFPADEALQSMTAFVEAVRVTQAATDAAAAAAAYGQMADGASALGVCLNTLAYPDACNNPCCSNMAGATERETVSGRSCLCAGCKVTRYCSRVCQKQHWKQHKPVCKALGAAEAAEKLQA
jgi:hypothetical protein